MIEVMADSPEAGFFKGAVTSMDRIIPPGYW
jgi:hypothetical protein